MDEPERIVGFTCVQCGRDVPRAEVLRHVQLLRHEVHARTNWSQGVAAG